MNRFVTASHYERKRNKMAFTNCYFMVDSKRIVRASGVFAVVDV